MRNCSMIVIGQWATTPSRKPPLPQPGPTSLHARCAPPRTDGRLTPTTTSSACARIPCSFNAVMSATNNSHSTASRPIKKPTVFYGVRLGHVPGVYTSWKEAKPHTSSGLKPGKRRKSMCSLYRWIGFPLLRDGRVGSVCPPLRQL